MTIRTGEKMLASDILDLTFFPTGSILMMDGSWTDGRGGWYVCDGRDTPHGKTPNLVNLFILGAVSSGTTGGSSATQSVTLTAENLPSHKHGIVDKTHTHTQDAHTHTQDSHNHTQDSHSHTQNEHNHIQDSHTHTDSGHSHSHSHSDHTGFTAQFTQVGFDGTVGVTAVGNGNVASNSGEPDQKIQITYTPDAHSTDATSGTASLAGATATNNTATATNQVTTATNQAATATNQNATATNQAAGTGLTETETVGKGSPITINAVLPPYYTVIYIKKMA
ncbi:MAG: hypothetical protein LBK68_02080 [Candidatus Margulisbacteria bacterium]|jgi:hypothetical protein|nr:hypothetical protein [Candidatus Margulisiibacteriota bacterium]